MRRFLSRLFGRRSVASRGVSRRHLLRGVEALEERRVLASLTLANVSVAENEGIMEFSVTHHGSSLPFTTEIAAETKSSATHKATPGADFYTQSGGTVGNVTLQFSGFDGEVQTFVVYVNNENRVEYTEEFQIRIDKIYAFMGPISGVGTTATGTITNDDSATITLSATKSTDQEASNGTPGFATFRAELSAPIDEILSLAYETQDGSATAANDYHAVSSSLYLFFASENTNNLTFDVTFKNDGVVEKTNEWFSAKLGALTVGGVPTTLPVTVSTTAATANITNDDKLTLRILPVPTGLEGSNSTVTATAECAGEADTGFSVDIVTSSGTATAGQDYTASGTTLNFSGAFAQTKTMSIPILNDSLVEAEFENYSVFLQNKVIPSGYNPNDFILDATFWIRTAQVQDNDVAGISINDVSLQEEAPSALQVFVFTITLSKAFDQNMVLTYDVYGGTASAADLVAGFGTRTVTIPANTLSITVSVTIAPDSLVEADETFFVDLQDVTDPNTGLRSRAFSFTDDLGKGTIENND